MTASQKQIAYQVIVITEQLLLYLYPSSRMADDAEFEENKHPRKKDGKFAPKGQEESPAGNSGRQNKSPNAETTIRNFKPAIEAMKKSGYEYFGVRSGDPK